MDIRDIDFYFITDSHLTQTNIVEDVKAALAAGVKIVQYREKDKSFEDMTKEASKIRELCRGNAFFIVNDYVDLAKRVDADGVHLGQDELKDYERARKELGDGKYVGVSASNVKEAVNAVEIGADYIGVGPIFATKTKKDAAPPGDLKLISAVRAKVGNDIPIVAIGGIKYSDLEKVIGAGADSVVAISPIFDGDIKTNVERFRNETKRLKNEYR